MKSAIRILTLLLIGLVLTACSSMNKPELDPIIRTSAPTATNLRSTSVPEGMFAYDSLQAMRKAWQDQDPNLGDMSQVPILGQAPAGMKAAFSAKPDEAAIAYLDEAGEGRSIMIYGYYGEDPDAMVAEFGETDYFSGTSIGGRTFHLLTDHADDTNREAYTLEDEWFIHVFASGFTAEEFDDLLADLRLTSLD